MRIRSVLTHTVQAVAEGGLIALLVVGLMAGTTFAAPPSAAASAVLTASPDPAPAYSLFHAEGCGYKVGKVVNITVDDGDSLSFFGVGVDGYGCVSFNSFTDQPALYTVNAYQNLKGRRQTLVASDTFTVQ